jgi:hypothetical protein
VVDHGGPAPARSRADAPGLAWTRRLARWNRADTGDHLVVAPPLIGRRSSTGDEAERSPTVALDATATQGSTEREEVLRRTESSPAA